MSIAASLKIKDLVLFLVNLTSLDFNKNKLFFWDAASTKLKIFVLYITYKYSYSMH